VTTRIPRGSKAATDLGVRAVDEQVLRVALGHTDDVASRWSSLRARFTADDLDDGRVYPLLQLVADALGRADVDDADLGRMRGLRRHAFVSQQLLFAELAPVLAVIEGAGARPVLIGGVPIAVLAYPEATLRPTPFAELLVQPDSVGAVVGALDRAGWRSGPRPSTDLARRLPALRFTTAEARTAVVVRWRLTPWWSSGVPDATQSCAIGAVDAVALEDDDLLLHTLLCAYRLGWGVEPLWVADVTMLARGRASTLDWDRFLEKVERGALAAPVRDALGYAVGLVDVPVPDAVMDALAAMPTTTGVARRYGLGSRAMVGARQPIPGHVLVVEWHRQTFNVDARVRARAVTPFVLGRTGAEHVWSVPFVVARRRWSRLA
jgi:hypothetical protein